MSRTTRGRRVIAVPLALALVALAACSGDDDPPAPTATSSTAPAASPTTTTTSKPPADAPTAALTGLPEPNARVRERGVIAIKIDNSPDARPQVAVDRADVVVEEPVEGGITRLMAVVQSQNPRELGPVRSARLTDVSLVRAFGGGALVFSGASSATYRRIRGTPHVILREEGQGAGWRRDRSRRAPHNLLVDQAAMRASLGKRLDRPPQRQFSYADGVPAGGKKVTSATLAWQATRAGWTWNPRTKTWLRTQNGTKDRLTNGKQLAASNVVVLQTRITTDPRLHDVNGARTPLPDLLSGGKAWLLRDGRAYPTRWSRKGVDSPFTFSGAAADKLALRPGVTWIELLPAGSTPRLR